MARNRERYHYRGRERTVEEVSRRAKQSSGAYDSYVDPSIPTLKLREGDSQIRILPPTWGIHPFSDTELKDFSKEERAQLDEEMRQWGNSWEIQVYLHRNIGPDGGTYLCRDKTFGEHSCPICAARQSMTDEEADETKPFWRALAWVIDRDNERAGPQVWAIPVTVFRDINNRAIDKRSNAVILIDDPEEGFDILLERAGTDKRTKYSGIDIDRSPSPIHDDEARQEKWMEYIIEHPLPTVLNFYDNEYLERVLMGQVERRRGEDEDGDEGNGRRRRTARRRGDDDTESRDVDSPRQSRRLQREPEPEEDEDRSRRRGPEDDEDHPAAEDDEGPRSRRRPRVTDPDEAPPEEEGRSARRRLNRSEEPTAGPGEEAPPEETDPEPSQGARRQLTRLRGRTKD